MRKGGMADGQWHRYGHEFIEMLAMTHFMLSQPTVEGDIRTIQDAHGGSEEPALLPGRDGGLHHHRSPTEFKITLVLLREQRQQPR